MLLTTVPPLKQASNFCNEVYFFRRGHAIDNVQVPADLEPGMYVLSFRWDCQNSSQVWSICSNVEIAGKK